MLRLDGVDCGYGPVQVLRGATLAVAPGEVLCLMGRNGAGKTTLCRAVMQLLPLSAGRVIVEDRDTADGPPHRVADLGLAYVPQGRRLFAGLTVAETLDIGLMARRDTRANAAEIRAETRAETRADILAIFPRLGERLRQRAETLSGGEQQMLATARALAIRPRYLLLDEPTEGLQPSMIDTIAAAARQMRDRGVGILLVEQKLDAVLALGDRVQFLENGVTREVQPVADVAADRRLIARYVGV
ncbi:MAG: ABC transporter ATP-binding protein [Pseudomonadota bacterium]